MVEPGPERRGTSRPPVSGSLVIAALLTLGLVFAASWIVFYVDPSRDPEELVPWFGAALAVIVALAIGAYVRRGRRADGA